jgi:uncharacterized protein (DUF2147 family)
MPLFNKLTRRSAKIAAVTITAALTLVTSTVMAFSAVRTSPHGTWKTVDDETGETKSIVRLYEIEGVMYGQVKKLLLRPGALCEKCEGKDHNAPIEEMVVVWGLTDSDADGVWEGGKVFDPEKNKTYRAKIWMDNGKVKIRGYLGPFFRTQTWYAAE